MYDKGKVITGLVIFFIVFTFPFWINLGKAAKAPDPKLDTPKIESLAVKACVRDTAYMKTSHMQLLDDWRNAVVREGYRTVAGYEGHKRYEMSLQNTCMECHSNKAEFCDQCHNYASVSPYCWDCHIAPKEKS